MKNKGVLFIILSTSIALAGVGYYFYRKYVPFKPTQKSAKYKVKIDFQP